MPRLEERSPKKGIRAENFRKVRPWGTSYGGLRAAFQGSGAGGAVRGLSRGH